MKSWITISIIAAIISTAIIVCGVYFSYWSELVTKISIATVVATAMLAYILSRRSQDMQLILKNQILLIFTLAIIIIGGLTVFSVFDRSGDYTAVGTVAMAWFGGIGLIFTAATLYTMLNEHRPSVYVEFRSDDQQKQLVIVVVGNAGDASARDITIEVTPPAIEEKLVASGEILSGRLSDHPLFSNTIPVLPPGRERSELYSVWMYLAPHKNELNYEFNINYRSTNGRHYSEKYKVNMAYQFGEGMADDAVVRAIRDLKESIDKNTAESRKIKESIIELTNKMFEEKE
jgi:hypothetical protein